MQGSRARGRSSAYSTSSAFLTNLGAELLARMNDKALWAD